MIKLPKMQTYYGYNPENNIASKTDFLYLYAEDQSGGIFFVGTLSPLNIKDSEAYSVWKQMEFGSEEFIRPLLIKLETNKNYTFHTIEDNGAWSEIIFDEMYKYTKLGQEIL